MKFNILIYSIIQILCILCEEWYGEVDGYDITDFNYGYAGARNIFMSDFYLCGERKYRVHYKRNYMNITWSDEFCCCQPAGIGTSIDAVTIDGGEYRVGVHNGYSYWMDAIRGYKNSTNDVYAGIYDIFIERIAISGKEKYCFGYYDTSSFEREVSWRIINRAFKIPEYIKHIDSLQYNYNNETEVTNFEKNINITIILLHPNSINYKGKIRLKIIDQSINYRYGEELIDQNLKNYLKEKIDFDYDIIKSHINLQFSRSMYNGNIAYNFLWDKNKIEIDFASKIKINNDRQEFFSYRGGFRFSIYLDENFAYFNKIKNACKIFCKYYAKLNGNYIYKIVSNLKDFRDIQKIVNELGNYSTMLEEIILFIILNPLLAIN